MIKLKRNFLNNMTAMQTVKKLSFSNEMPADTAYRFGRLAKRIDTEMEATRKRAIELLHKYAKKNEKGEIIGIEASKPQFEKPELEKEHDVMFEKLMDEEFEEKVNPIPFHALKAVKLSPMELLSIEDLMDRTTLP